MTWFICISIGYVLSATTCFAFGRIPKSEFNDRYPMLEYRTFIIRLFLLNPIFLPLIARLFFVKQKYLVTDFYAKLAYRYRVFQFIRSWFKQPLLSKLLSIGFIGLLIFNTDERTRENTP